MFFRKNLPVWERALRAVAGLAMAIAGAMMFGKPLAMVLIGGGGFVALTGFVGFCPMCALAGRRLDARK